MTKFKVGDKVRVVMKVPGDSPNSIGQIGRVIKIFDNGLWPIVVKMLDPSGRCLNVYYKHENLTLVNKDQVKSDGWETSYYDIPDTVKDIDDLIVHFGLNWHMANILKAAVRYGKKEGVTKQYDLNKIKFMVTREEKHNDV
jgi:hypothetical protein